MAEFSRFFNNIEGDTREYSANDFCDVLGDIISTGIIRTLDQALEVVPSGQGLSVNLNPGKGFFKGHWYANTEAKAFQLDPVDSARTDLIVIRLDNDTGTGSRKITAEKKNGSLIQTEVCYEWIVAEINLQTGQSLVTADNIVDRRGAIGSDYCPYASIPAAKIASGTVEPETLETGSLFILHEE